jgi:hypothetical protein
MRPEHVHGIASVTKTFVAALLWTSRQTGGSTWTTAWIAGCQTSP